MHYLFDMFGRFAGTSEAATGRSTEVVPDQESPDWNWNGVSWVYKPNVQILPTLSAEHSETRDEILARKWLEIKSYRDKLTQQGGYKAQGKWFHSDTFSRSQQLGLVIMGNNIPAGLQWKTMDGSFIEMTPALAQAVFQAAALQDNLVFFYAEQLNQQVHSSDKPASIDISQGWPETYQEV